MMVKDARLRVFNYESVMNQIKEKEDFEKRILHPSIKHLNT